MSNDNICGYLFDSSFSRQELINFKKQADALEKMALLEGEKCCEMCKELDFDGVLIEVDENSPYKKQILKARDIIGKKKALGVVCPLQRHAAMIVSEAEPEFVAFRLNKEDNAEDILRWYNELFLIQSAVLSGSYEGDPRVFDTDFLILNRKEYENFGC